MNASSDELIKRGKRKQIEVDIFTINQVIEDEILNDSYSKSEMNNSELKLKGPLRSHSSKSQPKSKSSGRCSQFIRKKTLV